MSDQNRDLYKYSGDDAGAGVPPPPGERGATGRFRDEAYRSHQGRTREHQMPGRNGDKNMVVYGDVYINQADNCYCCRTRADGRDEYYGRGYDYTPYQNYQYVPYNQYRYRQQQQYPNYYESSNYYYGGQYQQEGAYGRAQVSSGYERYGGQPYYNGGCFGTAAYGGESYASDWSRPAQAMELRVRGFDPRAGYGAGTGPRGDMYRGGSIHGPAARARLGVRFQLGR